MTRHVGFMAALLVAGTARAEIDEACADIPRPDDYDEQVQQDFQQNYYALTASYSPIHAAVPNEGGTGEVGVDLSVYPPLGCEKRFVLNWTKTEDTNVTPILPKLRAAYSFPTIADRLVLYASGAFLPPIPVGGTRNLVVSGEFGAGVMVHEFFDVGARFHTTLQRTYGDVATAFDPETEPSIEDVFVGSTWGIDAVFSVPIEIGDQHAVSPFASVGYLDASTFFFVGDSSLATNNLHPYASAAFSVGVDALVLKHLRIAGEFYGAPGGYSLPDETAFSVDEAARYGRLYTARFRLAYVF